jgi:hypothetical protein
MTLPAAQPLRVADHVAAPAVVIRPRSRRVRTPSPRDSRDTGPGDELLLLRLREVDADGIAVGFAGSFTTPLD